MINVIIVTYNGLRWIDKCLGSLKNQSLISSVIVIDNGSVDGTIEYIQEKFPNVNLIINQQNHGFGYSNNQGLKISLEDECQYAFLLNQDAWIEKDTLSNLIHAHERYPKFGILSPMHLRGDGKALDMKFSTFVAQSENHELISDLYLHKNKLNAAYTVKFVNAAAWLVTKECFQKIGGFAPIYYHYGEDMDYANRVLFHGFEIGICPSAIIHHDRKNRIDLPEINQPKQYLKLKKIWHLIYLTDINHSFTIRFFKVLIDTSIHCITSLCHLRLKQTVTYLQELGILIALWPKVLSNNYHTRKSGSTFLSRSGV